MISGSGPFVSIPRQECPCNETDTSGCNLSECSNGIEENDLCEADKSLPGGTSTYDVDNCPGGYDVFRRVPGILFDIYNNDTSDLYVIYLYICI